MRQRRWDSAGSANASVREGLGGRPLHLPDGVVLSIDDRGKQWRTAVEVELTRKTEARLAVILRSLLPFHRALRDSHH